jgi:hypothetical protein
MASENSSKIVRCNKCGTALDETPSLQYGERTPCPICGSLSRYRERVGRIARHYQIVTDTALSVSISETRARAKRRGKGKPFIDQRSKRELYRDTGEVHDVERIIDPENNIYKEVIRDSKTGEIIRECCEPLDKHTGHGYAKQKGDTKID